MVSRSRDWPALIEALGVFLLIMLYIWRLRIFYPSLWIVIAGFVAGSHFPHGEGAWKLGLRWREFAGGVRTVLPWVLGIAGLLAAGGMLCGTLRPRDLSDSAGALVVYIVWGHIQQYVLNGYFVNRLAEFAGTEKSPAIPLAAGMLFSAAHLPNWFLMPVTLLGGYAAAAVFLRRRSLYVLGLAHGLIGFVLNLALPDSITGNFLIGPRYLLQQYGFFPEELL